MLFTNHEFVKTDDINEVKNIIEEVDLDSQADEVSNVSLYINSFVSGYYQKSVHDIENTKIGNRITRKRNLKQIMKESFFYGANRFGTNFIA